MKSCVEEARRLVKELNSLSGGEYEAFIDYVGEDRVIVRVIDTGCTDCSLEPTQFLIPTLARKIGLKVRVIGALNSEQHSYIVEVSCLP
ncbi:MAG: hypothetical protein F7B17_03085 [Desulfurococcales archaeon]|nr:hypothetical protein [Desulfurococcales archaeon]